MRVLCRLRLEIVESMRMTSQVETTNLPHIERESTRPEIVVSLITFLPIWRMTPNHTAERSRSSFWSLVRPEISLNNEYLTYLMGSTNWNRAYQKIPHHQSPHTPLEDDSKSSKRLLAEEAVRHEIVYVCITVNSSELLLPLHLKYEKKSYERIAHAGTTWNRVQLPN